MAYSDIQQTEFNRATENLIEITWTYVNLQKEFPKLSETDSMGWKQMFVVWANEFEENYGRTDWDESEKTYQEAIEEFAKEKIFQWVGIRKYICIVFMGKEVDGLGEDPFRIRDTRIGRNNGRIYPYYDDAVYRIDGREGE